ncbi:hypothetical protein BGW41_006224 [Actinomortierella wolfii]|nr:hypothetical protein BGW41_006224 [Actinomortierella wolfii]
MQIHGFLENHDKTQKLVCSTEQAPAPAPKKQPDPNLKLLTILTEMGSLLAQSKLQISMDSRQPRYNITPEEKTQAEFSLTALYMASNIARFDTEQGIALEPTLVRRRAAVYEHLGMLHYASHCYSETSVMPGCTLADREWDEFRSLLLAMEADDPIRTTLCLKRTAMPVAYLDAQVLIMLADAIETADVDVLENDVRTHIDHLRLLVKTDAADQLLMAKYCSQTELMKIVDRIHKLIPS